jgi:hypothetical protein
VLNQATGQLENVVSGAIGNIFGGSGSSGSSSITFLTSQDTFLKKSSGLSISGNSSVREGVDYCKISGTVVATCAKLSGTEYFAKGVQGCSGLTSGYIYAPHVSITKGSATSTCQ